ncbi:MAG: hypothetical protein HQ510_12960 [Candidatus Marinimicrobia bacterium]|nr:hypothetical protein [Candidatus Neomarinimicrobiota bacterium]
MKISHQKIRHNIQIDNMINCLLALVLVVVFFNPVYGYEDNSDVIQPGFVNPVYACEDNFDVVQTGVIFPIIITSFSGAVNNADCILAYAELNIVGVKQIDDVEAPQWISVWGAIDESGIYLPGYTVGDSIIIRVWSSSFEQELYVEADLDYPYYGIEPLTIGSIFVFSTFHGDINQDSFIDILDIVFIIDLLLYHEIEGYQFWAGELNEDNSVDVADILVLIDIILVN